MKVEVDIEDLEYLLLVADESVYWKPRSIAVANRLEDAIAKAKENYMEWYGD
jgi:hypothetical protein